MTNPSENRKIAELLGLEVVDYGKGTQYEGEGVFYFKAPPGYCGPMCKNHEHVLPDFLTLCRKEAGLE